MSRRKKHKKVQATTVKLKNSDSKLKTYSRKRKSQSAYKKNKKSRYRDNDDQKKDSNDDITVKKSKLMVRRYEEFHENFLDYDKILKFLEKTQKCNASTVDLVKIGNSTQGKPIYMILITSTFGNTDNPKMATFIEAGLNGENAIAVSNTLYMIEYLTKNPNSVKIMDYYIVPCCNPDAYDAFIKNKQKNSNKKGGNYCDPCKTTSQSNISKGKTGKSRSNTPKSDKNDSRNSRCAGTSEDKIDVVELLSDNTSNADDSKNDCCDDESRNDNIKRVRSRSPIKKTEQREASNSCEKNNTNSSKEVTSTKDCCHDSSIKDNIKRSSSRSSIGRRRASCNSISGKNNSKKAKKRSSQANKLCSRPKSEEQKTATAVSMDLTLNFPVVLGLNDMQRISTGSFLEHIKHWKEHYVQRSPETTALINAIYKYQFAIKLLIFLQEDGEAVCHPYGFCSSSGDEVDDLKEIAKKGKGAITARNFEYGSLYEVQGLTYGNLIDFLKVDKASIKYMYVIKVHKKTPKYTETDELRQLMRYGCEIMECIKRMSCCVYKYYTNMTGNRQVETASTKRNIEKRYNF